MSAAFYLLDGMVRKCRRGVETVRKLVDPRFIMREPFLPPGVGRGCGILRVEVIAVSRHQPVELVEAPVGRLGDWWPRPLSTVW